MQKISRTYRNALVLAALFAGCSGEHPIAPPPTPEFSWKLVATGESFVEVWGSSGTEIFASGSAGTLLRYDGSRWTTVPTPVSGVGSISAIWGTSPQDIFIGTGEVRGSVPTGTIYHYDGAEWEAQYTKQPGGIHDLWGTSGQDVFAVGSGGLVLHYDGSAWTPMSAPTTQNLYGVWGSSGTDVFVVGEGITLHYGLDGWTISNRNTISSWSVWGSSSNDVYVAGTGALMHYDGVVWNRITAVDWYDDLRVWGRSSTDVYIISRRGHLHHYNGTMWTEIPTWMVSDSDFYGIWGSDDNLFVVGGGDYWYSRDGAAILHYNGTEWKSEARDVLKEGWAPITAVGGSSPNDVYFAGVGETLLHYDGSGAFIGHTGSTDSGENWNDVSAASPEAVFLVDRNNGIVRRYSTGADSYLGDWVRSVWAISATEAIVVGSGGRIYHLDGNEWVHMTSGTTSWLSDVWASSAGDAFAVGEAGTICHYDGSTWRVMPTETSNSLLAVWGSSGRNVFAVGEAGTILHYDGSSWHRLESPTDEHLTGVWSSSPADVFAVGRSIVLHYDGTSWTRMKGAPGGTRVWGSSPGDVYLIDGARIFHYGI